MLVAVHAGRSAWLLSSHRMTLALQDGTVADLVQGRRNDGLEIAHLTAVERELQQRVDNLEDEVLEFQRAARGFEMQLWELRAALGDVRRAE